MIGKRGFSEGVLFLVILGVGIFLGLLFVRISFYQEISMSPEEPLILEGTTEVIISESFEEGGFARTDYYLVSGDNRYKVEFGSYRQNIVSGMQVRLNVFSPEGVASDEQIYFVEGMEVLGGVSSAQEENLGEQRTAVIIFNSSSAYSNDFIDENGNVISEAEFRNKIYERVYDLNYPKSLNNYLREVSYGRSWVGGGEGDIYGVYALSLSQYEICDKGAEIIGSIGAEIDFSQYSRVIVVSPVACDYYGVSTLGKIYVRGRLVSVMVMAGYRTLYDMPEVPTSEGLVLYHEFGHGLGLSHANLESCSIGSNGEAGPVGENCQSAEYGDYFDTMGNNQPGHFNALHKEKAGFFNDNEVIEVNADDWGTYTLNSLNMDNLGVKMIKINSQSGLSYSLERRKFTGFDQIFYDIWGRWTPGFFDGVILHSDRYVPGEGGGGDTQLLLPIPTTDQYAGFREGEEFNDVKNGVHFKVLDVSENEAVVKVGLESCGNGVIDEYEECDGQDLGGLKCLDKGFLSGDLICDDRCKIKTNLCQDPICVYPAIHLGGFICEIELDGEVEYYNLRNVIYGQEMDFEDRRYSQNIGHAPGAVIDSSRFYIRRIIDFPYYTEVNSSSIYRVLFNFPTSSLPDDSTILSSSLIGYVPWPTSTISNTHPNGNDKILLISNPNYPVDNPLELADRIDLSEIELIEGGQRGILEFLLNEEGMNKISKNSNTKFGVRTYYDAIPNSSRDLGYFDLSFQLEIATPDFPDRRSPFLKVIYAPKICGNSILQEGEECDDGNRIGGDGCDDICMLEITADPVCGDWEKDEGEQCDDGNTINGDGCNSLCLGECFDSDYGNYYKKGTARAYLSGTNYTDYCYSTQYNLMEYSCVEGLLTNSSFYCANGCLNGACRSPSGSSPTPVAPGVTNPSPGAGAIQ